MKKIVIFAMSLFVTAILCNGLYASGFMVPMKGTIKGMYPIYSDTDEVTITSGYCEANGKYYELGSGTDYQLTNIPYDEDFVYIYVDDDNSTTPTPTLTNSVNEPSWSDAKQGWYYGDDRCIGVVWSPSGSSIAEFQNNSGLEYIVMGSTQYIQRVLSQGTPSQTSQFLEATYYTCELASPAANSDFDLKL